MLQIPNLLAADGVQPEAVIALDNGEGQVAQHDQNAKNQSQGEGVNHNKHHGAQAVGQMHPFSPAGFHNKFIQIFQGKIRDVGFRKPVFGDKLGDLILPELDFQVVLIPAAALFPMFGLITLALAVENISGKAHTEDKYHHMPPGH